MKRPRQQKNEARFGMFKKLAVHFHAWRLEQPALVWILGGFILMEFTALGWDLPGSHGWENDGIAPRDLFAGIAYNLTPGQGHRYPLLHNLIVGLLSLPALLPSVASAENWTLVALKQEVLATSVMTGISVTAKLVTVTMACVALVTLGRIGRRLVSPRAGSLAMFFAATMVSFAYYGRTSNLDVPYLTWTVLALFSLLNIGEHGSRRHYLTFAFCAGAAVATKDQAYATFVLVAPLYLILFPLLFKGFMAAGADHWKRLLEALGVGALTLGVLGGGLLNPTGWLSRLEQLTGPNSKHWRAYERSWSGLFANLEDLVIRQSDFWWPWPMVVLAWLGVWAVWKQEGDSSLSSKAWRMLPLVAGLSALFSFTLVVGRSGHRFVLPLGFWLSFYGGAACDRLLLLTSERRPRALRFVLFGLLAWGLLPVAFLHFVQWGDARNQVRQYLEQVDRGTVVETYGLVVQQPHFNVSPTAVYKVQRVGPKPVEKRNPLTGVEELQTSYMGVLERAPDVLVIPEAFANRFLNLKLGPGQALQKVVFDYRRESDGVEFFQTAIADELPYYRMAHVFEAKFPDWAKQLGFRPPVVHGSTGRRFWVFKRLPEAYKTGH